MIKGFVVAAAATLLLAVASVGVQAGSVPAITMTAPQARLMKTLTLQDLEVYRHGGESHIDWGLLRAGSTKHSISKASLKNLFSSPAYLFMEVVVKALDTSLPDNNQCKRKEYRRCIPDMHSAMQSPAVVTKVIYYVNKYGLTENPKMFSMKAETNHEKMCKYYRTMAAGLSDQAVHFDDDPTGDLMNAEGIYQEMEKNGCNP